MGSKRLALGEQPKICIGGGAVSRVRELRPQPPEAIGPALEVFNFFLQK